MENIEIARMLHEYALLLDIQGENPFRVRAYRKAAQTIEDCRGRWHNWSRQEKT